MNYIHRILFSFSRSLLSILGIVCSVLLVVAPVLSAQGTGGAKLNVYVQPGTLVFRTGESLPIVQTIGTSTAENDSVFCGEYYTDEYGNLMADGQYYDPDVIAEPQYWIVNSNIPGWSQLRLYNLWTPGGFTSGGTRIVYIAGQTSALTTPGTYTVSATLYVDTWYATCDSGEGGPHVSYHYANPGDLAYFSGSFTVLVIDNLLSIDSLEATQGIQENNTPDDLALFLSNPWMLTPPAPTVEVAPKSYASIIQGGDMPVPLVAFKPSLLRIYFPTVSRPTNVTVRVWKYSNCSDQSCSLNTYEKNKLLLAGCTPAQQRLNLQNSPDSCSSVDVYWDANQMTGGTFDLAIFVDQLNPPPFPEGATVFDLNYAREFGPGAVQDNTVYFRSFTGIRVENTQDIVIYPVSVCHDQNNQKCGDVGQIAAMAQLIKHVAPGHVRIAQGPGSKISVPSPGPQQLPNEWWESVRQKLETQRAKLNIQDVDGKERHVLYGVVHPDAPGIYVIDGIATPLGHVAASRTSAKEQFPDPKDPTKILYEVETNVGVMAHEIGHNAGLLETATNVPNNTYPGCFWLGSNDNFTAGVDYLGWPYTARGNYLFSGDPSTPNYEVGLDLTRNRVRGPRSGDPYQSFEMMGQCYPRWVTPWSYRGLYRVLLPSSFFGNDPSDLTPAGSTTGQYFLVSGTVTASGVVFDPIFTVDATGPVDQGSGPDQIEVLNNSGGVLYTKSFTPLASLAQGTSGDIASLPYFSELLPVQSGAASIVVVDSTATQLGSVQLSGIAPTVSMVFPAGEEVLQGIQNVSWSVTDPDSTSATSWVEYSPDNGTTWIPLTGFYSGTILPVNFDDLPGASSTALIRVYASDGANTGNAVSKPFSVRKKLPQATITYPANGAVFHVGDFLNLEGSGYTPESGVLSGTRLTWSSSDLGGTLGTGDEVSLGYLDAGAIGNHTITLTATDASGNQVTASISIVIQAQVSITYPNQPPVASAGGPYTGVEGSPVAFSDGGSYAVDLTALTYAWNFGDGGTATGQSTSHVFADNGTYQVTLTVTDQEGRTGIAKVTAVISNVPPTVVAGAAVTGKTTRPVTLSASFSDPGLQDAPWKVSWSFGDGSTSPITSVTAQGAVAISHTYQGVGQFQVKVTATDKDGGAGSATIPVTIISIADVNNDGKVDCADLAIVKASFGKKAGQAGFDPRADVNNDGVVNVLDLSIVAKQIPAGMTCP